MSNLRAGNKWHSAKHFQIVAQLRSKGTDPAHFLLLLPLHLCRRSQVFPLLAFAGDRPLILPKAKGFSTEAYQRLKRVEELACRDPTSLPGPSSPPLPPLQTVHVLFPFSFSLQPKLSGCSASLWHGRMSLEPVRHPKCEIPPFGKATTQAFERKMNDQAICLSAALCKRLVCRGDYTERRWVTWHLKIKCQVKCFI